MIVLLTALAAHAAPTCTFEATSTTLRADGGVVMMDAYCDGTLFGGTWSNFPCAVGFTGPELHLDDVASCAGDAFAGQVAEEAAAAVRDASEAEALALTDMWCTDGALVDNSSGPPRYDIAVFLVAGDTTRVDWSDGVMEIGDARADAFCGLDNDADGYMGVSTKYY